MRHRYRVSLYDDSDLDKEIVDYLASTSRKQEMIRTFMRAGFAMVVKKQEDSLAYLEAMDDGQKALLAQYAIATRHSEKENSTPRNGESFSHYAEPGIHRRDSSPGYLKNTENGSSRDEEKPPSPPHYQVSHKTPEELSTADTGEDAVPDEPVDFMTLLQQ